MRLFRRKSVWYIDFTFEGKRIRQAVGTSKKEAQQALDVIKGKILSGKFDVQDTIPCIAFEDLAKLYIPYAQANKKSWKRDITSLRKLLAEFGDKRLNEITPFHIEKYKQKRRGEVSAASVNRELQCMKYMYNLAIKWEKGFRNPVREVKLFREKNQRLRFLSEDEIIRLIDSCPEQLAPLVIMAIHSGMRFGEIRSRIWSDIDFDRNLILIDESKSGSPRQIPMSDYLRETLLQLKSKSSREYVFVNKLGKPYQDVREAFKRALEKAGITDCTFHTLRHTFASHLVMSGVDLATVKELLGHKTIQMTMRYAHLSGKHKQQAVNILDRRFHSWHKSGTRGKIAIDRIAEKPYKY